MLSIEQYFQFKYKVFGLEEQGIDVDKLEEVAYCTGLDFQYWDEDAEERIYKICDSEEEFVEEMMYRYEQDRMAGDNKSNRYMKFVYKKMDEGKLMGE